MGPNVFRAAQFEAFSDGVLAVYTRR
ncbi:hypothetical protein CCACVL1_11422 [Corchorus capsularis]|uniref:Uncharacterized protein n=1 Tax=Corchorus capsularis TaxID=210143 RepID=A0A1R3ILC2_COCAP|nr:hypothetical protein CCACVL1_11422 [Corchorus capsularis]